MKSAPRNKPRSAAAKPVPVPVPVPVAAGVAAAGAPLPPPSAHAGPASPLQALQALFRDEFHLLQALSLEQLCTAEQACWFAPLGHQALRFGTFLDVRPDLLVAVPSPQGVLGLVHLVPAGDGFIGAVRSAVNGAVQLRQLLLETAESAVQRAPQVELLLLVPQAAGDGEKQALADELNHISRRTSYLRLIGLNLLLLPDGQPVERDALRRAFCWLLHDTRAWFAHAGCAGDGVARSWELALQDYRLAGDRRFSLAAGEHRLHLVHGHNGSGKSTLVEALELLLTRKIERLDRGAQTPYHPALRHRPRSQPPDAGTASAVVQADNQWRARCVVAPTGHTFDHDDPSVLLRAHSFRIDQPFMNDLVRADQHGRAQLFLEAFAPGETRLLADVHAAEQAFEAAWSELPAALRPAPDSKDSLATRLAWVDSRLATLSSDDAPGVPPGGWIALLPLAAADLLLLAPIWHQLADQLTQLQTAPRSAVGVLLNRIDTELAQLRGAMPAMLAEMRVALRVLQEFAGWRAAGQTQRGDSFDTDLQRWLELRALTDLAGKHADIVGTLARAAARGWEPDPADAKALPQRPWDRGAPHRVALRRDELRQELSDARERLRAWQDPKARDEGPRHPEAAASSRRFLLTPDEIAALDRVGVWVPAAACPVPLGRLFAEALTSNQARTLQQAVIGQPGGLDLPIVQLQALVGAAERMEQMPEAAWLRSEAALRRGRVAFEAAAALQTARQKLLGSFFWQLAGGLSVDAGATPRLLRAAVNELLALATPARWDYSDIDLRGHIADGKASLSFDSSDSGARADLLLNTAELSAFTLVLFLLLAPRVENPLRLLVLDDPLQNMDEMMVCTLARALAQLLAVLPAGWTVLALFHGVDDMERIREEAPSVVYELPWARPFAAAGSNSQAVDAISSLSTAARPPLQLSKDFLTLVADGVPARS